MSKRRWRENYDQTEDDGYSNDNTYDDSGDSDMYFCELCKVPCAGPVPYASHLKGKKHKKAEAAVDKTKKSNKRAEAQEIFCEICNIKCTGIQSYQAHVNAVSHEMKLKAEHERGKIESIEAYKIDDLAKKFPPMTGGALHVPLPVNEPVGENFVEELKDDRSSVAPYFCRLCNCRCTDKLTMDNHVRGRPHRLRYKKKVDPSLDVDKNMIPKNARAAEEKLRKDTLKTLQKHLFNMRACRDILPDYVPTPPKWMEQEIPFGTPIFGAAIVSPRPSHLDDLVRVHNVHLLPTEDQDKAIKFAVRRVERALENLSNDFVKVMENALGNDRSTSKKKIRNLKGVVRVGSFATSTMLRGERAVQLVVVCEEKPTTFLMHQIKGLLECELERIRNREIFAIKYDEEKCLIRVTAGELECCVLVSIAFTSFSMRDENNSEYRNQATPADVLDPARCIEALANMRRTRWYQGRCNDIKHCRMMVRIFGNICRNVKQWRPLSSWALAVIIEHTLCAVNDSITVGEAFRRIFEAFASGILLPDRGGIRDPCNEIHTDVVCKMRPQEREDLTASAQMTLRLIAFEKFKTINDLVEKMKKF